MEENKELVPVEGSGEIIGHWDEKENKFIPLSQETLDEYIGYLKCTQYSNDHIFEIRVSTGKIHGKYHAYRSFGLSDERTIFSEEPEKLKIIREASKEFMDILEKKGYEPKYKDTFMYHLKSTLIENINKK